MHPNLPPSCQKVFDFEVARIRLSRFVERKAAEITRRTGIHFEDAVVAPSTYEEVLAEYHAAVNLGKPFRVFSGASDTTIYEHCGANFAFRFWHDYLHAKYLLSFSREDEIKVGAMQVAAVVEEFGPSLEARLMFVDSIGQVEYFHRTGGFPEDQTLFALEELSGWNGRLSCLPPTGRQAFELRGTRTGRISASV